MLGNLKAKIILLWVWVAINSWHCYKIIPVTVAYIIIDVHDDTNYSMFWSREAENWQSSSYNYYYNSYGGLCLS